MAAGYRIEALAEAVSQAAAAHPAACLLGDPSRWIAGVAPLQTAEPGVLFTYPANGQLDVPDLVLEQQLALLQAPQLHLVHVQVELQAVDHVVEVAVLDAQLAQPLEVLERLGIDVVDRFSNDGTAPWVARMRDR